MRCFPWAQKADGKPSNSYVVADLLQLPLGILTGIGFIGAGAPEGISVSLAQRLAVGYRVYQSKCAKRLVHKQLID